MNSVHFQIGVSLDGESINALAELFTQAWEKAIAPWMLAMNEQAQSARSATAAHAINASKQSTRDLSGDQKSSVSTAFLIDCKEAARLLGISARTLYRLADMGRLPRPTKIGSLVRWNRRELNDWINAGCPNMRSH